MSSIQLSGAVEFRRDVRVVPAYDERDKPSGGQHCCDIVFALIGSKGAISLTVFSGWVLPSQREALFEARGADLSFHAYHPVGGATRSEKCRLLDGADCYGDGSALLADDVFKKMVASGSDAMWTELERYYDEWLVKRGA
jgi:hypothetical protein